MKSKRFKSKRFKDLKQRYKNMGVWMSSEEMIMVIIF